MNLEKEVEKYIKWAEKELGYGKDEYENEEYIPEDRHSDPMDVYHQFVDLEV